MSACAAKELSAGASRHFMERARELVEFCLKRGGPAFAGWEVKTLFAYAFFHLVDRTVFCLRERGAVSAALFAWALPEAEIRRRHDAGESPWAWRRSRDGADAIFLAEVIGDRAALPLLVKRAGARWPDWRRKKIFTYRAGRLVELTAPLIDRMLGEGPAIHNSRFTVGAT